MYAGFWKRTAAFALDYVLIAIFLAALMLIGFPSNAFGVYEWLFSDRFRAQLTGFLLITLPVTLYFALGESSPRKATWGKSKLGLQVTDDRSQQISFGRFLARTGLKFVPWELSHTLIWTIAFSKGESTIWVNYGFVVVYTLIGLNLASLIFTKKHQPLYDLLAKTYVIRQH